MRGYRLPLYVVALGVAAGVAAALLAGPGALLDWLLLPIDGAGGHHIAPWAAWHARLMVAGWGVLIPAGVLIARYFKVTPRQPWPAVLDNKLWWRWHRLLQYSGLLLAGGGLYLAVQNAPGGSRLGTVHAWMGWTVLALGVAQVAGGLLRGSKGGPTDTHAPAGTLHGDHYDMTPRRIVFEIVHKGGGYAAIVLAMATIVVGLRLADAPRWMWIVIPGWWVLLGTLARTWQRAGYCLDTYQAIWGADPALPGNQRRPIGLGVRRASPD